MQVKPPRAVIVDDDPFFRTIFSTCLRTLNWEYGVMESGYELINYFLHNGESYDIAIISTDLPLPGALETAESVKLFIPEQRIIFTGVKEIDLPEKSFFIKKPVDFSTLIRFLQSINDSRIAGTWNKPGVQNSVVEKSLSSSALVKASQRV